ncbi:MAG: condensation domain-containing protein, partial [Pseudomonadota bacterium]
MKIIEVIERLSNLSIAIFVEDGKLKTRADKSALTPEVINLIKDNKDAMLKYFSEVSGQSITSYKKILPQFKKSSQLSFTQQRLWLLDKIDGGNAHYNKPGALKLTGILHVQALNQVFTSIVERHESLRSYFVMDEHGQPLQVIQAAVPFVVPMIDISQLDENACQLQLTQFISDEASRAFDLSCDLMLRAQLIKVAADEHILLVTMSHIASDGWSMSILINEFSALYGAYVQGQENPLTPLAIQYADYAYWQRNWLQGEVLDRQLGYWTKQLSSLPTVHNLPLDYPRPSIQSFVGKNYSSRIDRSTSKLLNNLCQLQGATLFMGLHAAFSVLLSRYSNETDIIVGSPIANREQAEVANLIGFFANTLVLRSDLSASPNFTELLRQSKNMLLDAYAHQQVPFEQIVERLQPERSLSHGALFQIMLVLQNNEQGALELPGLLLSSVEQRGAAVAKYDLTLSVSESEQGFRLDWEYNTHLFEQGTIARMANHFELLLDALVKSPNENVFNVEMLSGQERQQLLGDWNNTQADYPNEKCIHELFEMQVQINPNTIAVIFDGQQLTYEQLNQKANQLAHYLIQEKHVTPDTLVGICVERSLEMVIGILAILKAGGAYVPLDPEYPEARLQYMLEDANLTTVLTQRHLRETTPVTDPQAVCLDSIEFQQQLEIYPTTNPDLTQQGLHSKHLAYVIYTSGSTGNPKGVIVEHQALVNRIDWMNREYGSSPADRMLQKTPFSFDVSVWEFVWP